MALSKQEKEELANHFKGKDLYDPSKAPEQEVATFAPQMCNGGMSEGYADGGYVDDLSMSPENLVAGLDTEKNTLPQVPPSLAVGQGPKIAPPQVPQPQNMAASPALVPPAAPAAVQAAPAAPIAAPGGPGKLSPDEFSALIRGLQPTTGQRIGQGAMSGLAGLADAIETGVARTNGSNFQKNITEMDQNKRKDLIDALKAKYEAGFKGEELAQASQRLNEEVRSHGANEKEAAGRLSEEKRAHDLEAGQRGAQLGYEHNKLTQDQQKAQTEADLKTVQDYGTFKTGGPSKQVYQQAMARLQKQGVGQGGAATVRIKDSTGKLHDIPAQNLAKAKQRDPGLQVVQ